MNKIVILGSGFASLTAIKNLNKLKVNAEIIVISPTDKFNYLPSVIWVPYGKRTRQQLEFSLDKFFAKYKVTHKKAAVIEVNKTTIFTDDGEVDYDYLLIATGGQFIKKVKGIVENVIIPCEGIKAGEKIQQQLDSMQSGVISFGFSGNPNEPTAMRGGPVFEFMFGIDTWLRQQKKRDKFILNFISPATKPGQRLGEKAVKGLLKEMKKRNIKTYLGEKITEFGNEFIKTETQKFKSDLTIFMPGMTGLDFFKKTPFELSDGGFIKADKNAHVIGFDNIFVAGDAGSFEGPDWRPKQAHMADLQAICAVKNIKANISSQPQNHTFKTELFCIVDTLDSGILVFRNEKFNIVLKCKLFHFAKILFEKLYLKFLKKLQ